MKIEIEKSKPKEDGKGWFYSDKVKEHFFNPKNVIKSQDEIKKFHADGEGEVGSPACGDIMKLWIKIDKEKDIIIDSKWQTFGCASAIASTSVLSEMIKGMKVNDAMKLNAKQIVEELGGLPSEKIHCSVLGDQALIAALKDYFTKTNDPRKEKLPNLPIQKH